jgi:hypothetical protein
VVDMSDDREVPDVFDGLDGHGRQIALKPRRAKEISVGRDLHPPYSHVSAFRRDVMVHPPERLDAERQTDGARRRGGFACSSTPPTTTSPGTIRPAGRAGACCKPQSSCSARRRRSIAASIPPMRSSNPTAASARRASAMSSTTTRSGPGAHSGWRTPRTIRHGSKDRSKARGVSASPRRRWHARSA